MRVVRPSCLRARAIACASPGEDAGGVWDSPCASARFCVQRGIATDMWSPSVALGGRDRGSRFAWTVGEFQSRGAPHLRVTTLRVAWRRVLLRGWVAGCVERMVLGRAGRRASAGRRPGVCSLPIGPTLERSGIASLQSRGALSLVARVHRADRCRCRSCRAPPVPMEVGISHIPPMPSHSGRHPSGALVATEYVHDTPSLYPSWAPIGASALGIGCLLASSGGLHRVSNKLGPKPEEWPPKSLARFVLTERQTWTITGAWHDLMRRSHFLG